MGENVLDVVVMVMSSHVFVYCKYFNLVQSRDMVCLSVVANREQVTLEMVEFVFKGQYIGRHDMWQLMRSLHNTCVYIGKEVTYTGIRVSCPVLLCEQLPSPLGLSLLCDLSIAPPLFALCAARV